MDTPIDRANDDLAPMSEDEINAFFDDLDKDKNGSVSFAELEARLHEIHNELAPEPAKHNLHHPSRRDVEKNEDHNGDSLHAFLFNLMPDCSTQLSRPDFIRRVKKWEVPSRKQSDATDCDAEDASMERKLPFRRRVRAYWAVHGRVLCFTVFVMALQLAFGLWQMIKYLRDPLARAASGWGVVLAKASAGVLYPTFFFMLLSMSRHFSTFLRRNYYINRFINWDLSQIFHIRMSIVGLFFASLHAIGHLNGTFVFGSSRGRQENVASVLGPDAVPRPYITYVRTLPGWSGLTALGLFWTISLLSMPFIRKRSHEIFQLGHLLMFPMIGLLCAHGTAALLQAPMLGYWLAFPALLVIFERVYRLVRGLMAVPARAEVLDNDTIRITCKHPQGKDWKYSAGQYILLQVPKISHFQWHPFTISSCRGNMLQVHIKFDGDWTNKLQDTFPESQDIKIGIDGPFGAPAQRFYDYDYSIIVGGGIGITPFAAILTDLEEQSTERKDPWAEGRRSRSPFRRPSRSGTPEPTSSDDQQRGDKPKPLSTSESTAVCRLSLDYGAVPLAKDGNLELNINTHITAKRKNISTHVFRYLLDSYRTEAAPYSTLTGLRQPSHFGRPDFDAILEKHFEELVAAGVTDSKVGIFYCGAPVVGEVLSDKAHMLTAKARDMGLHLRYDFLMEVFG
ncbi:hypothetical protein LTR78_005084 [Recurvomyces mirabilis]|uniref:Uncharacterized protein n=1 Tax=Recurvomyces mirabilis TaxID=574656 RepID=A0AAE1C225_9PEZI|nr:hypothetical protein LTR78_005084 [Recurvomyces mirabilis]KAK5158299.1 hypothetical protein LTS14_003317 [Recurvomyces mirabilis]